MNWLHYLLEANLYLAVFYTGYYLFLSRETHYTLNRIYLLFSSVISFVLPVIQLGILKPVEQPVTAVHFAYTMATTTFIPVNSAPITPAFTLQDGIVYGYLVGGAVLLLVLMFKLYQLFKLTRLKKSTSINEYKIIFLNQSDAAFSFFNYMFIGTKVEQAEMIIKHEMVHIRQKHSVDVIFIELLKIVNWFNPFIYLLQNSLKAIHEYIADEKTATSGTDALTYSSFLVNNAYGLSGSSIAHSFFNYNLLKKRIIMLHQKRSGSLARLKYLLAVPICGGLLCASTLAFSKTYGWVDLLPNHVDKKSESIVQRTNSTVNPVKTHKTLQIMQLNGNGSRGLTDKFTSKQSDGSFKTYTAYNLTNKDKEDLKKHGFIVSVVTNDTTKIHIAPPPPPAPPVRPHTAYTSTTSKNVQVEEYQYLYNNKIDFSVAIYKGNSIIASYFKSQSSPAIIKLLSDKYGYTFPANGKYELAHSANKTPLPTSAVRMVLPRAIPADPAAVSAPSPTAKMVRFPPPVVRSNAALLPPPPPAPPVKRIKFPLPNPMTQHTAKGYYYSEAGYMGDIFVTIKEKDGSHKEYDKNKATAAELSLLKDKYGYVFPAYLRVPTHANVIIKRFPPPTVKELPPPTVKELPPPPPPAAPVNAKVKRYPPPTVKELPAAAQNQMKPPPPPPFDPIYKDFFYHIEKTILYPKKARTDNIMGTAIAQYTLDDNHHVTNVQVIKSDADIFNAEIIKSMTSYAGSINKQPGKYSVAFRFCLDGETNTKEAKDGDAKLMQTLNYTGELTIVGYKE